jgi:hypothetical protein
MSSNSDNTSQVYLTDAQTSMLEELSPTSDYWTKSHDFIHQVLGREICSLSQSQLNWYYNIKASLDREIEFDEARVAFNEY